jgi:hypothetical protein
MISELTAASGNGECSGLNVSKVPSLVVRLLNRLVRKAR